ncbi:ATP-dependent DNA helicase [Aphis craccivora]|uniref:ATP-dependent DNA helicase n=1 Tax=Aphis craccivora TaxID=307492 RepID=A0A6G0ZND4_APHCR|nr:ATP-dependent DNA helicase [Aphis craccivora]
MNYDFTINYKNDPMVLLGAMFILCQYYLVLKWNDESKAIILNERNIHRYNNAFQMKSFKSRKIVEGNLMPTFKVQGQIYFRVNSETTYQIFLIFYERVYHREGFYRNSFEKNQIFVGVKSLKRDFEIKDGHFCL